jgi:tetratricopeptide (TPR) repeat protein/DNA-directed RNA polymerase subunit M/transcription elongation factor TFIIS
MNCTNCNFENPTNSKFCIKCGAALIPAPPEEHPHIVKQVLNRCPKCNFENPTNSKFCTTCGETLGPPASTVVASIIGFLIGLPFVIVGITIAALTIFAIFAFPFFMIFQDDRGRFPWSSDESYEDRVNETYQECKGESSSLSVVFFDINTDSDKLQDCLREKAFRYRMSDEEEINALDIPTEFKVEILAQSLAYSAKEQKEIAEATKALDLKITGNPPTLSEEQVIFLANDLILSNRIQMTSIADPAYWRLGLCVLSPIEEANWNGEYWEFGKFKRVNGLYEGEGRAGKFYEKENYIYIDIEPACDPKFVLTRISGQSGMVPILDLAKPKKLDSPSSTPEERQDAKDFNSTGVTYGKLGQYERATQEFTEAIRLDPQHTKAYYNRGIAYGQLGQHEQATQDFAEAIRLDPQHTKAYYNRGIAYGQLGQHEQATQDFAEAIRLDPQYAKAYYNRGIAYGLLGDTAQAERDKAKAKELGYSP